jgi:serine/threonine-protein kinase
MEGLTRWRLVRQLGAGAFGEVHLAWDSTEARWVALKQFIGQDELGLLRFVIESRIRVEHPHLVRTLAFRLVDDQAWLVTELARGGSLRPLMDRGPLPTAWVAEVVDQVLDALGALHAAGVIHRDVKPANLLLRDPGAAPPHVLVGDFGIAVWRTVSMTGVGAAIGTPGYLAPEYLDGTPPSPRTDLFALGVVAAELLSGRRLVHSSNAFGSLPADWDAALPLPDTLPADLAQVLRRMADPDPDRRYTDCHDAREALRTASPSSARQGSAVEVGDLLAGLPPVWKEPDPSAPRPRRWFRPVAAACAVVAVLGAAGVLVWQTMDDRVPGTPSASSTPDGSWTPVAVEPCSRVDIGRVRLNGSQRCQRVAEQAQSWVAAPLTGFPPKSNPSGPLPDEPCTPENASDYSPAGTRMLCGGGGKWQVRPDS